MATDPAVGTVVAGYRIVAPVGRGGMGVVYQAEEVGLGGRPVALKLLPPGLAGDPAFRERFLREMRVAAAIDHPNIIPVYRAGEERGRLYIAMRYVDTFDLRRVLQAEGRLSAGRTLAILAQVARALDAAHARGLVHRDVKPGNILLVPPATDEETEHVYLVDFGLARSASDDLSISGTGQFLGTPRYAAPEQVAGQPVDGRTDGYALGCVLFECLTGRPPFSAGSNEAVLVAHLEATPPLVTAERPDLPPAIDPIVQRAMAKAKQDRFPSCRELVAGAHPRPATGAGSARPLTGPPSGTSCLDPPAASGGRPGRLPAAPPTGPPGTARRPGRNAHRHRGRVRQPRRHLARGIPGRPGATAGPGHRPGPRGRDPAGAVVPGLGHTLPSLVPPRLRQPDAPWCPPAALPALVGARCLGAASVQPVSPQAAPERHLAGQRPRPPIRHERRLAPATGEPAARLVVDGLSGLHHGAQHHHRVGPRGRLGHDPRAAAVAARPLPGIGRHTGPRGPAHRAGRPARAQSDTPDHHAPGAAGGPPGQLERPPPPKWLGSHRTGRTGPVLAGPA